MALSIVHRATGVALYFGTLLLAWWLIAAASGPGAYANVQAFAGSIIGKLIGLFGGRSSGPSVGTQNIIGTLAGGTDNWRGGLTRGGEGGPELAAVM